MSEIAVTLDIDWAPDFAIDAAAALLADVPATWFVTHASPAVERLRQNPRFELGIHPNFLPGSTHGETVSDVLRHCLELVPDALSMRTHSLVQSTPLLSTIVTSTPIRIDVTMLFWRTVGLRPFRLPVTGGVITRVPFLWEDDVEMVAERPDWNPEPLLAGDGVCVFNFHPVHVFLNSPGFGPYQSLKSIGLQSATEAEAARLRHHGDGTRTMLERLLASAPPEQMRRIRDLA